MDTIVLGPEIHDGRGSDSAGPAAENNWSGHDEKGYWRSLSDVYLNY